MESKNEKEDFTFTPREYQVEIVEMAKKSNTIVFLPTGSGKTFIATMLIKSMSHSVKKLFSQGGKRTFFLVNTVALVQQQADSVARQLPLNVATYSGDMAVDYWNKQKWHEELEKNQVLVMTAQIFLNLLLHDYLRFSDVNLLIMDECHHTMRNHGMNQIMDLYKQAKKVERPRILGLTATLLNANCKLDRIDTEIKTLESNLDSKIVTSSYEDSIQRHSTNPNEQIHLYNTFDPTEEEKSLLNFINHLHPMLKSIEIPEESILCPVEGAELINESRNIFKKKINNMLKELHIIHENLGLYATYEASLSLIIRFERIKLAATVGVIMRVLEIMITKLHHFRKKLYTFMKKTSDPINPLDYCSPKLWTLCQILSNNNGQKVVIVFVERRTTAKILFYFFTKLAEINKIYSGLKTDFIVGFNNNPYNDSRESLYIKKSNIATLRKFNNRETNLLFASDVIEEGIDIRTCNLVIKFDPPNLFRSYIQSKGRARSSESTFILLMPKENKKSKDSYQLFKRIEEYMKQNLNRRWAHNSSDISSSGDEGDEIIPPYCVDSTNARVTSLSAISLVNRYCSVLPQDRFCLLTCYWWVQEIDINGVPHYRGILKLPVNSAIKNIIMGPPYKNKLLAKQAVALETCKMLHQLGELDSNLLPVGNYCELMDDKRLFPHWDFSESRKTGSRKYRRICNKRYSIWECECRPKQDINLYIHLIKITPTYEKPEKTRLARFYEILNSNCNFSIITSKKWPQLCQFSMYLNVGEVNVELLENIKTVKLTNDQINQLFLFHSLLFTEVLPVHNRFVMRDYENRENCYFIIPTILKEDGDVDIDWKTINNNKALPVIKPLSNDERRNIIVDEEKYLGKIVVPWYRPEGLNIMRYIVTRVCTDESPDSPFPSINYTSYSEYFQKRYNQNTLNPKQPLIEVRAISSKLNCILPRGKSRSSREKRLHKDDFEETLIPELCCLVEFPSVYMLKITVLPSILHRIHYLLISEELRQKIAQETCLGVVNVPSDFTWKPLKVDLTAVKEEDRSRAHSTIQVSDMLTSNMNALKIFPWKEEDEPYDIERQLYNVDLLAIIHYVKFMNQNLNLNVLENGEQKEINSIDDEEYIQKLPVAHLDLLNKSIEKNKIGPEQSAILTALTAATSADVINLERLETLGDSFLKFIVSMALFIYFNDKDEGKLTQIKGKVVGNRNFYFVGRHIKLDELLKVHDFSPSEWEAPCVSLAREFKNLFIDTKISPATAYQLCLTPLERDSGILHESTRLHLQELIFQEQESDERGHTSWTIVGKHCVPDKTVSDAVEALIGVYLQAFGIDGGLILCRWLGILAPQISDIDVLLYSPSVSAKLNEKGDTEYFLIEPEQLEKTLHYKFKDRSFLLQALTHSSFHNNVTDCYQRLEFLGDAILDFLITTYIYENCGNLTPGELTDLRSALVNNVTFACLCVRNGFHKHLNFNGCQLNDIMLRFVHHQECRNHKIGAEVLFLIEEENAQVAESIDVPKILGDVFESIAGAIYLDSGKDLQVVWNVYYNLMKQEIEEFSKNVPKNHIRLLYEKFPSPLPKFGSTKILPDDDRVLVPLEVIYNFKTFFFHGIGDNKRHAKLAAAKMALRFFHEKYQVFD